MRAVLVLLLAVAALSAFISSAPVNFAPEALRAIANDGPDVSYFWQLTDPHIDLNYKEGNNPDCDVPACCHTVDPGQTRFAGKFGIFGKCDTPPITLQSALDFVKEYPIKPAFVFYGGDNTGHDDWQQTREMNLHMAYFVHDMIHKTLTDFLVLPSVGNHDSFPVDQLDTPPKASWFLDPLTDIYGNFLPKECLETVKYGGYYSLAVKPGMRVISLNTQYSNPLNFWLYKNTSDPASQTLWLTKELANARANGEKVYILGHIPPGLAGLQPSILMSVNTALEKLVAQYGDIIVGQFYGHTHSDFFKMFRDSQGKATGVAFVSPAVTSWQDSHPSVRLWKFNSTSFDLLDSVTFYGNLTEANEVGKMTWRLEYSAKDTYQLQDMSPTSWDKVLSQMMATPSNQPWADFCKYYSVLFGKKCSDGKDLNCKKKFLCEMKCMNFDCYHACTNSA